MMRGVRQKRKSLDPTELKAHSAAKKERTSKWYQEEAETLKERKEKKRFFGLGGLLTRMRSSSRICTESTSQLPRMDSLLPEPVMKAERSDNKENTPENEKRTPSGGVPLSVKRNTRLRALICETPIETIFGSPDFESDDDGFHTPSRKASRYSLPPNGLSQLTAPHSEPAVSHGIPTSLRRSARRIRPLMARLDEEVGAGSSARMASPTVKTSPAESEANSSPSTVSVNEKATPLKRSDTESVFRTPRSSLRPSGVSSSALGKFGGMLKRGLSSGSRALGQAGTPVMRIMRRDTLDSTRGESLRRRRCSDVTCYSDVQSLASTPTSSSTLQMQKRTQRARERIEHFTSVVRISELVANVELEIHEADYDAIIIDTTPDAKPVSTFSAYVIRHFSLESKVREALDRCYDRFAKTVVVRFERSEKELVVSIGLVRDSSDLALSTRIGYDAAIAKAVEGRENMRILLAPAFLPCDTPYNSELADAMLRTLFMSLDGLKKELSSVTICGTDERERILIRTQFDAILNEKRDALEQPPSAPISRQPSLRK